MTLVKIKKSKKQKKVHHKRKLKFENYKTCLKSTQLENKTNRLEQNKIDIDSHNKDHKEFIKKKTIN